MIVRINPDGVAEIIGENFRVYDGVGVMRLFSKYVARWKNDSPDAPIYSENSFIIF